MYVFVNRFFERIAQFILPHGYWNRITSQRTSVFERLFGQFDSNSTTSNSRIKEDTYSYRDMSSFDPLQFKLDLSKLYNIHLRTLPLVSPAEVDHCFSKFVNILAETIDRHAPLKMASRKKQKLISKPWVNKRILVSIRKKQKLYVNFYRSGTDAQKLLYKTYANKLTKIKRLSKKLHLHQEIVNSRHDMRKFWGIVKTSLPNNQKSNPSVSLTVDGTKVTDSTKIADCFNNHFCSIRKSLADNIDSSRPHSYSLYLQNRINASMFLRPTTAAEIYNLISH